MFADLMQYMYIDLFLKYAKKSVQKKKRKENKETKITDKER